MLYRGVHDPVFRSLWGGAGGQETHLPAAAAHQRQPVWHGPGGDPLDPGPLWGGPLPGHPRHPVFLRNPEAFPETPGPGTGLGGSVPGQPDPGPSPAGAGVWPRVPGGLFPRGRDGRGNLSDRVCRPAAGADLPGQDHPGTGAEHRRRVRHIPHPGGGRQGEPGGKVCHCGRRHAPAGVLWPVHGHEAPPGAPPLPPGGGGTPALDPLRGPVHHQRHPGQAPALRRAGDRGRAGV